MLLQKFRFTNSRTQVLDLCRVYHQWRDAAHLGSVLKYKLRLLLNLMWLLFNTMMVIKLNYHRCRISNNILRIVFVDIYSNMGCSNKFRKRRWNVFRADDHFWDECFEWWPWILSYKHWSLSYCLMEIWMGVGLVCWQAICDWWWRNRLFFMSLVNLYWYWWCLNTICGGILTVLNCLELSS